MFGRCAKGVRHGWFSFVVLVMLAARSARAQTDGGFPIDELPQPVAPARRPAAPVSPPAPVAPRRAAPAAPAPVPVAPVPTAPAAPLPPPSEPVPPAAAAPALPANLSLPLVLPYRAGMPVPPGYHVESSGSPGLVWTGASALVVGYVVAIGIGANNSFDSGKGWLAAPVVGPWPAVANAKIQCTADTVEEARKCLDRASNTATTLALIAVDGMIQTTGLLLLIAGLANRHSELVRDDIAVHLAARQLPGGFDLGVAGHF